MKHRVQIDIAFENEQDAVDLMNHIEGIKGKAYNPNNKEKVRCFREARYHHCSHDEQNPQPCKDYINVDFDKPKKVHEKKEAVP